MVLYTHTHTHTHTPVILEDKNNGITLISLVVTIIILLILAGVTLALISGSDGILSRATASVDTTHIESAKEQVTLKIGEYQSEFYEGKYVTQEIDNASQQGDWIFEQYGGQTLKVKDYEFKITLPEGKEVADAENPYIVTIQKNRRLPGNVTGTLTVDGILEWDTTWTADNDSSEEGKGDGDNTEPTIPDTITATIHAEEIVDNHTTLTLNAKNEKYPIQSIELYIAGKKVKTYSYTDSFMEKEETYALENIEFYKNTECYIKVINTKAQSANSNAVTVFNSNIIATLTDLQNLATEVNKGNLFQGKTIYLTQDITTNENWIPIGYWDKTANWVGKYFAGTFEGNDHTITIPSLSKDANYHSNGIFGMVIGGKINHLTVKGNMSSAVGDYVGGIVGGIKDGEINNCTNQSENRNTTNSHGGVVGTSNNSKIQNCTNTNTIYGGQRAGGVCGYSSDLSQISNCNNSGFIKSYETSGMTWGTHVNLSYGLAGGVCGLLENSNVSHCSNTGEITGAPVEEYGVAAGGIVGWAQGNCNITTSQNKGNIHFDKASGVTANGGGLGGIVGVLITSTISECFNTNTITSKYNTNYGMEHIGGISGYIDGSTIKNSYNTGSVYGHGDVGGVIGVNAKDYGTTHLYNCYNASETVEGVTHVGNYAGFTERVVGSYNSWIKDKTVLGADYNSSWGTHSEYTLAQMKTVGSGLLNLLSQGDGNGVWSQEAGINEGLPYLVNNRP